MNPNINLGLLEYSKQLLPVIKEWFAEEWPDHYGEGGSGRVEDELLGGDPRSPLPVTLVAYDGAVPVAVVTLQDQSVETHKHLSPWAGLLLVRAEYRKKGIGSMLISEMEDLALGLGFVKIYAGTNTADKVLESRGWKAIDKGPCHMGAVTVFEKEL